MSSRWHLPVKKSKSSNVKPDCINITSSTIFWNISREGKAHLNYWSPHYVSSSASPHKLKLLEGKRVAEFVLSSISDALPFPRLKSFQFITWFRVYSNFIISRETETERNRKRNQTPHRLNYNCNSFIRLDNWCIDYDGTCNIYTYTYIERRDRFNSFEIHI